MTKSNQPYQGIFPDRINKMLEDESFKEDLRTFTLYSWTVQAKIANRAIFMIVFHR
jgi:hypothetical protein